MAGDAGEASGDEPLYAGGGVAVSAARIVTSKGTFAVASVARVRSAYTQGGRVAAAVLVLAGTAGALGFAWQGEVEWAVVGGAVALFGVASAFVRPAGYLYLTTGDREQLVARGGADEIAKASEAIERAMARRR